MAICRLAPEASLPQWIEGCAFFCVARTAEELSIVCPEARVPAEAVAEPGWAVLQLLGPFPFSLTGVLASFLQPLAVARIPIFAISTFDTDYVLIKRENLQAAIGALGLAGHSQVA